VEKIPRIVITPGEPAGIGPDILLKAIQQNYSAELIAVCDPEILVSRAALLNLPIHLENFEAASVPETHSVGTIKIIPVKLTSPSQPGKLNSDHARYVIQCLEIATDNILNKKANALVTGPVQKSIINDAGISFSGHTEFLAKHCHVDDVIMLFVTNKIKVALVTTHLPLADVPKAITSEKILSIVRLLQAELQKKFAIAHPKILITGLNPHAGENGYLGTEEIKILMPAIKQLQSENINITGPFPADTIFTDPYLKNTDVILAMYHDQALPVVKYLSFGHAVNVTLGLPIIRTSVDHGTALDKAGTKEADAGSLIAAIELAIRLSKNIKFAQKIQ